MKTENVICPVCGKINQNLYLEETGGCMECDRCGTIVENIPQTMKKVRFPVPGMKWLDDAKYRKIPVPAGSPI